MHFETRQDSGLSQEELLAILVGLESHSEHPLAKAIVEYGEVQSVAKSRIENFQALVGAGLQGEVAGKRYFVGSKA